MDVKLADIHTNFTVFLFKLFIGEKISGFNEFHKKVEQLFLASFEQYFVIYEKMFKMILFLFSKFLLCIFFVFFFVF